MFEHFLGLRNAAITVNLVACSYNRVVNYQENEPVPASKAPDRMSHWSKSGLGTSSIGPSLCLLFFLEVLNRCSSASQPGAG